MLPGTLAEDELPNRLEGITKTITDLGATNVATEDMGKNKLAYPMKHIRYGYFFLLTFTAEGTAIPAMQEKLKLMTELLRCLFTAVNPDKKEAQQKRLAAMQAHMQKTAAQQQPAEEPKEETPPAAPAAPAAETPAPEKKEEPKKKDVSMEDIDKKLDEILDASIANI